MNKNLTLGLRMALLLAGCAAPTPNVPKFVVQAALVRFPAPIYTNISIGPTTKPVPYTQAEGVYARWCVEVKYTKGGTQSSGTVVVNQILPRDTLEDWDAQIPVLDTVCK